MTTWFTSDLHFLHRRIVEFTNRGKETTQEGHTDWLTDLWNNTVAPEDTVWHLGDFSFGKKEETLEILRSLNGIKRFIKGNHDSSKDWSWIMQQDGFKGATFDLYKEITLGIEKVHTCLFHFPISSWHKQGYGAIHLHGHSHGNLAVTSGKMLDVGLDSSYNIYGKHKFFSEEDILEIMKSKPRVINDHHAER